MSISVLIPTYDRDAKLELCLTALAAQTDTPDKVVVVDDGGSDRKATEKLVTTFPDLNTEYVYLEPPCEDFRAAKAINLALRSVKTDRVLRIDADCIAEPSVVALHRAYGDQQIVVAGGYLRIPPWTEVKKHHALKPDCLMDFVWVGDGRVELHEPETPPGYVDWICFGCHISYPTKTLKRIGGANEEIEASWHDDIELGARMIKAGCKTFLTVQARVFHLDPIIPIPPDVDPRKEDVRPSTSVEKDAYAFALLAQARENPDPVRGTPIED